jgi:hypothetical protein
MLRERTEAAYDRQVSTILLGLDEPEKESEEAAS